MHVNTNITSEFYDHFELIFNIQHNPNCQSLYNFKSISINLLDFTVVRKKNHQIFIHAGKTKIQIYTQEN